MSKLLNKLLVIQKAIDCIAKSEKGFNYSYAGQEQVLNTIRPLMNDQGLLLMQEVLEVENTRIDYVTAKGQSKSEILTSAKQLFTWMDCETDEKLAVRFHANGMNDWEKGLGSALTYAERYFLLKFFHIPTPNDDPDARQTPKDNRTKVQEEPPYGDPEPPQAAPKPQTEDQGMDIPLAVRKSNTVLELEVLWGTMNDKQKESYKNIINIRKKELTIKTNDYDKQ